ncbi:hypothetical protein [Halegenticoccus soli]|uniref:hypothetical protein n=1 Tax=Halegenticoccus soli TaxID=1985678 RepID=UPI000C6EEA91|nr:hypothetical protein [Halegenticoccus soli]
MDRRSLLATAALALAGSSAGCLDTYYRVHPLPPIAGRVVGKGMTGRKPDAPSDSSASLLTVEPDAFGVDPTVEPAGPWADEPANVTVTSEAEEGLLDRYDEVFYHVRVEHENANHVDGIGAGDVAWYSADRATFNRLMVGDDIRFQLGVTGRPRLSGASRIVRRGTVRRLGAPDGGGGAAGDAAGTGYSAVVDHGRRGDVRLTRRYATDEGTFGRLSEGKSIAFHVAGDYGDVIDRLAGE